MCELWCEFTGTLLSIHHNFISIRGFNNITCFVSYCVLAIIFWVRNCIVLAISNKIPTKEQQIMICGTWGLRKLRIKRMRKSQTIPRKKSDENIKESCESNNENSIIYYASKVDMLYRYNHILIAFIRYIDFISIIWDRYGISNAEYQIKMTKSITITLFFDFYRGYTIFRLNSIAQSMK